MPDGASGGGTGSKLGTAAVIVCGVAALVASLLSFLYVWPSGRKKSKRSRLSQQANMTLSRSVWLQTYISYISSSILSV